MKKLVFNDTQSFKWVTELVSYNIKYVDQPKYVDQQNTLTLITKMAIRSIRNSLKHTTNKCKRYYRKINLYLKIKRFRILQDYKIMYEVQIQIRTANLDCVVKPCRKV